MADELYKKDSIETPLFDEVVIIDPWSETYGAGSAAKPERESTYGSRVAYVVSDNFRVAADAEQTEGPNDTWVKKKEVVITKGGTITIKFDLKKVLTGGGGDVKGRIYIDGVAVGTERATSSTSYVTYSEDIAVKPNEKIQLYLFSTTGGGTANAINFRFYWDTVKVGEYTINTD